MRSCDHSSPGSALLAAAKIHARRELLLQVAQLLEASVNPRDIGFAGTDTAANWQTSAGLAR